MGGAHASVSACGCRSCRGDALARGRLGDRGVDGAVLRGGRRCGRSGARAGQRATGGAGDAGDRASVPLGWVRGGGGGAMSNGLHRSLGLIVAPAIIALVWLAACGEGTGPDGQGADSVIVSNPVPVAVATGFNASLHSATGGAANEDLVFVALEPGTVPAGQLATVRKVGATN